MQFLFPLFLFAAFTLLIPIIIHLINQKKHKKVWFPDLSFLKQLQIETKQHAKIKNWKLLITRLLLLALLVFAFAQPFWQDSKEKSTATPVIYIDNSFSMMYAAQQNSLLAIAKSKAKLLLQQMPNNSLLYYVNNDNISWDKVTIPEAIAQIDATQLSAKRLSLQQLEQSIAQQGQQNSHLTYQIFAFSDLQQNSIIDTAIHATNNNTSWKIIPIQPESATNIYIDTAYFVQPFLEAQKENELFVRVKTIGTPNTNSKLQLHVNGQVQHMATMNFESQDMWSDTLGVNINTNNWEEITLSVQDQSVTFDDTFRIAAKAAANQQVLVVGKTSLNPYLNFAFNAIKNIHVKYISYAQLPQIDFAAYALVIFQDVQQLDATTLNALQEITTMGSNLLLLPDAKINIDNINQKLQSIANITISGKDTTAQTLKSITTQHPLLADVFEKLEENITLPRVQGKFNWNIGIQHNPQQIMTFKDGQPFLVQCQIAKSKVFILASPIDITYSNFVQTDYFAPLMYKMATQSGANNIYAYEINSIESITLPIQNASQQVWQLERNGDTYIPYQQQKGKYVHLFPNNVIQEAGFYSAVPKDDATAPLQYVLAFNTTGPESNLQYYEADALAKTYPNLDITVLQADDVIHYNFEHQSDNLLWKYLIALALLALVVETYFVIKKR